VGVRRDSDTLCGVRCAREIEKPWCRGSFEMVCTDLPSAHPWVQMGKVWSRGTPPCAAFWASSSAGTCSLGAPSCASPAVFSPRR